jgi:hypothetical protein
MRRQHRSYLIRGGLLAARLFSVVAKIFAGSNLPNPVHSSGPSTPALSPTVARNQAGFPKRGGATSQFLGRLSRMKNFHILIAREIEAQRLPLFGKKGRFRLNFISRCPHLNWEKSQSWKVV